MYYILQTVKIGLRHPDPVVETSSLSSVTPPEVWYKSSIPEESIDSGWLSALQLEAVTYAAQVCHGFMFTQNEPSSRSATEGVGLARNFCCAESFIFLFLTFCSNMKHSYPMETELVS